MSAYYNLGKAASKTPLAKKVIEKVKDFFKPRGKVSNTIKSVNPNVPVSRLEKAQRNTRLAQQRRKSSDAKLDNTVFRIEQEAKKLKDMQKTKSQTQTRPGKMGGGMMGRRMGYSQGKLVGNQKKIDVAAPFGTIDKKDFAKLRTKKKGAKNGKTMS